MKVIILSREKRIPKEWKALGSCNLGNIYKLSFLQYHDRW